MEINKNKISIIQGVFAIIVAVAFFMPWFRISLFGFGRNLSFFDIISALIDVSRAQGTSSSMEISMFYFFPFIAIVNVVLQWIGKFTKTAFYLNLLQVLLCIIAAVELDKERGVSVFDVAEFGFLVLLITSILATFTAWGTIGANYYSTYKRYMKIITWCCLGSCLIYILIFWIPLIAILLGLMVIFWLHIPYVLFGWLVVLATRNEQKKAFLAANQSEEEVKSEATNAAVTTSSQSDIVCPQCHNKLSSSTAWEFCPYCGFDLTNVFKNNAQKNEEEPSVQARPTAEDDHLRYAPNAEPTPNSVQSKEEVKPVESTSFGGNDAAESSSDKKKMIIGGAVGAVVLLGIIGYYAWYAPYAKDRDAMRTYVIAYETILFSSDSGDLDDSLSGTIPYGTEVITYSIGDEWAEVKVAGVKGYIAKAHLADAKSYNILYRVWGDANTKQNIGDVTFRRAILDYCNHAGLKTGKQDWQLFVSEENHVKDNFFVNIQMNNEERSVFAFILKNNTTQERCLAVYAFNDSITYTNVGSVLVYEEKAPKEGGIKDIKPKIRKQSQWQSQLQ